MVSSLSYPQHPRMNGRESLASATIVFSSVLACSLSACGGSRGTSVSAPPASSQAVAGPRFSLASGTYDSAENVTISAASGTTVYYTTDGSPPTTGSRV